YLLGLPSVYLGGAGAIEGADAPVATPELAIVKSTKQYGFASAAFVAYWADTGELVSSSGPFVGRTLREDWWILGFGPKTVGDIPPAEKGWDLRELCNLRFAIERRHAGSAYQSQIANRKLQIMRRWLRRILLAVLILIVLAIAIT